MSFCVSLCRHDACGAFIRHTSSVVSTDWRAPMASSRGAIQPASPVVSHSLLCLHLEAVILLEHQVEISRKRDQINSFSLRKLVSRQRPLLSTLVVLFGMLFMAAPQLAAQSTFGSIRGLALDNTGAAVPDSQITLHSVDKNIDRVV